MLVNWTIIAAGNSLAPHMRKAIACSNDGLEPMMIDRQLGHSKQTSVKLS